MYFQNLPSAAAGITLSNIQAGHIENRIRQTGAITDVYAALLQAIVVDSSSPATPGTVTTARALSLGYWGRPSGTSTQTVTNVLGIEMAAGRVGSGVTITTITDMSIANPSAPTALTNHYGIDIAALTRASSVNVGIRNQAELRQTAVAMFGGDQTASARVHISEPTLGNEVFRIESVATNDDPSERVFQNRVATTDATVTTLHTYTIPASTTVRLAGGPRRRTPHQRWWQCRRQHKLHHSSHGQECGRHGGIDRRQREPADGARGPAGLGRNHQCGQRHGSRTRYGRGEHKRHLAPDSPCLPSWELKDDELTKRP